MFIIVALRVSRPSLAQLGGDIKKKGKKDNGATFCSTRQRKNAGPLGFSLHFSQPKQGVSLLYNIAIPAMHARRMR